MTGPLFYGLDRITLEVGPSPPVGRIETPHDSAHRFDLVDLILLDFEDVRPVARGRLEVPRHPVESRYALDLYRVLVLGSTENAQSEHKSCLRVGDIHATIIDAPDVAQSVRTHLRPAAQCQDFAPFREIRGRRGI